MTVVSPLPQEDLDAVLDQTRALWNELSGERVFITGGTGFFGTWLLESFLHANRRIGLGAQAVVLTRDPEAFSRAAPHLSAGAPLTMLRGDVTNFDFPAGRFACVIHAATEAHALRDEPVRLLRREVLATRHTLDFAEGASAARYLLTSSGAVYGVQPPELGAVGEDHAGAPDPADPSSAYGLAKRESERLCIARAQLRGFHVALARCFAFVGPRLPLDRNFAVGNFLADALRGEPIRVAGDGTPYRSYMYASDLATWLWTVLLRGASCRPYNVGSEQALSIAELAERVRRNVAPSATVQVARAPRALVLSSALRCASMWTTRCSAPQPGCKLRRDEPAPVGPATRVRRR